MKRIISTAILCMLISMTFAQKKVVKDAKKAADSDKYSEARELIKPALTDPESATDPETWKVLGDIDYKIYDKEKDNEKLQLVNKTAPDQEKMYTSLYNFYLPYLKADSLGQLPDEKGKIKNKFRKDISNRIKVSYPDYYNGGAYYSGKGEHEKAADYFVRYAWVVPALSIFESEPINTNDSLYTIVKYYAAISAMQAKNHDKTIDILTRMTEEPYYENTVVSEAAIYELLGEEYKLKGDSVAFMNILQKASGKFPKSNYFITNLINIYISNKDYKNAVSYLDQAIINSPANTCEFSSAKARIFLAQSEYDEAFVNYEKALAADENCEAALDGLSSAYIFKAQSIKEQATSLPKKEQVEADTKAIDYYKKAIPLLTKFRSLLTAKKADNSEIKAALYKLSNVYYNLNMGKEYEEINKEYEAL